MKGVSADGRIGDDQRKRKRFNNVYSGEISGEPGHSPKRRREQLRLGRSHDPILQTLQRPIPSEKQFAEPARRVRMQNRQLG
jgi:hypothetical protein